MAKALITAPIDGAVNVPTAETFTWTPATGAGVQGYYLIVGTTAGGYDVVNSGPLAATTTSFSATLPASRTLAATIFTERNGVWTDYHQVSFATVAKALITAPIDGAVNVPTAETFTWTPATGAGVQGYYLIVGTTAGGYDVVNSGPLAATTTSFSATLPASRTLLPAIFTERNGVWTDYHQISFATVAKALMTAPTDGAVNVPTAETFTWTAATGAGVQGYYLIVGTTAGGYDVVNSGLLAATTTSFAATLPASRTLFARHLHRTERGLERLPGHQLHHPLTIR